MQSFDNIPYAAAVVKNADRVVPLSELLNNMAICKKNNRSIRTKRLMMQTRTLLTLHWNFPEAEKQWLSLPRIPKSLLLIYHVDVSKSEIFMLYETSRNKKVASISIQGIRQTLSLYSVCQLWCAHAISGCNTTSATFRRGKVSMWRLMSQSTVTPSLCHIISQVDAAHENVLTAGLKLLVIIHGGKPEDADRTNFRHRRMLQNFMYSEFTAK